MKSILSVIAFAAVLLSGCSSAPSIAVPPGSLTSWTHTDTYGPYSDHVVVTGVVKNQDGTFTLGHYDGAAGVMGWGPHDIIEGLTIDGSGKPAAAPPISPAK